MKIKAILEGILVGLISAIFSYSVFISRATFAAIVLLRKMPDAWFSGSIVWYATLVVMLISIGIAAVAYRVVYKYIAKLAPVSTRSE
jgi:hypothetical protein